MALSPYQLPFASYAPHPDIPGAYNFAPQGGGNPMMFAGDTSGMRRAIDAAPDNRLASNTPPNMMPGGDISGAIQGFNQQPTASDALSHAAPQINNPLSLNQPLAAGVESAGQERGVELSGNSGDAPIPTRNLTGQSAQPSNSGGGGGAPLVNPQDYVHSTYTKPHWQDTTQKVVTEGGANPERASQLEAAYTNAAAADKDAVQMQKANALSTAMQSQIEASDAAKQLHDIEEKRLVRQAALQTGADEYGRIMAQKQEELATASKREVDQYRMYKGNAGAAIGAALAAGLGAFGASISHTPNFAMDFINRSIDRDVEAQKDEINRGVASKQNDIARIRDKYNVDTGVAEKLLAISLTEQAQQMARKQAATAGGQAAQQQLATLDQQFAQKILGYTKDMRADIDGKATATAEQKFVAGGTSVSVDPKLKAGAQAAEYIGKTGQGMGQGAEGSYKAQHEGMTAAQVAKAEGGGKGAYTAQTISAINAAETAEHALRHAAAQSGIEIDEQGNAEIKDYKKWAMAQIPGSAYHKALDAAIPEVVRGQTGAAPTNEGQEHARSAFSNPLTATTALQENIKLLRSARGVRLENKKYPVAATGASPEGAKEE